MKKSGYILAYTLLSLLGLCILFFGISQDFLPKHLQGIESVLQGFGGAVLGIGLSNLIGLIRSFDFFEGINDVIGSYLGAKITSDKEHLKQFKGIKLYGYHTTKTHTYKNGCWVYQDTEFFMGDTNTLSGKGVIKIDGDAYEYGAEVGVRGKQLIVVFYPLSGDEGTGVVIFPNACLAGQKNTLYGIGIGESFTGEVVVRAYVYSKNPLVSQEEPGVVNKAEWNKLDEKWRKGFQLSFLLPDPLKSES